MVERGGLENRCGRKPTEGSNPSLSAILPFPDIRTCSPKTRKLLHMLEFLHTNNLPRSPTFAYNQSYMMG